MLSKKANRIFLMLFKVGLCGVLLFSWPVTSFGVTEYSPTLVDLTNNTRLLYSLESLTPNQQLKAAAQLKVQHMFDHNYFDHISPDGKQPWEFLAEVNYGYQIAGENLAMDFVEVDDAHQAWLQSSTHRQLILDPKYQEIGIAYQRGQINGQPTILIVALFGNPE